MDKIKMKTIFCFSAFFLLIFTDICSAAATKTGFPHMHETKTGHTHLNATKAGFSNLQAAEKGDCSKCPKHEMPMDCAELKANGVNDSGVHTVYPRSRVVSCKSIDVYCDMETDGGGWTVIQRRGQYGNGETYFNKKWKEYKEGFGNMKKEFWLGNEQICALTNQGRYSVRMDMTNDKGQAAFSHYENFWIEDEGGKYKLHVSDVSGPAGDGFISHDGYEFYASDQPNFANNERNSRSGGWWRNNRRSSSLNGLNVYKTDKVNNEDGITWDSFGGYKTSMRDTEIKIRPKKFNG